jgi:hypothetical protein
LTSWILVKISTNLLQGDNMSKETFTPHLWTYTDYLESTDREDTSESKQRWQEVVYILSTQYGEELQNVVSIIINHIDEEEIE